MMSLNVYYDQQPILGVTERSVITKAAGKKP
jgi:hypothetical protein